jgi:hypothetical protein
MSTPREVAEWMVKQFDTAQHVYQETIVYKIRRQFGEPFVYTNENGNLAISRDVLKHFRALTDGTVVWERGDRSWRKLRPGETYRRRQVD